MSNISSRPGAAKSSNIAMTSCAMSSMSSSDRSSPRRPAVRLSPGNMQSHTCPPDRGSLPAVVMTRWTGLVQNEGTWCLFH
jgi:hypothetical protein